MRTCASTAHTQYQRRQIAQRHVNVDLYPVNGPDDVASRDAPVQIRTTPCKHLPFTSGHTRTVGVTPYSVMYT